jgi:hypothetical protein
MAHTVSVKGIDIVLQQGQNQLHFIVMVPADQTIPVSISQHWRWQDSEALRDETLFSYQDRLQMRQEDRSICVLLTHQQWQAVAGPALASFNTRLKQRGVRAGRWKTGATLLSWDLGRELVVLAWGIELANPALISFALRNWQGLLPEERRWLYTMVQRCPDAATFRGRGRAWRMALQYILTENPVSDGPVPQTTEVFTATCG